MANKPKDVTAVDPSKHGIAIEFPDDHTINGIRIRVLGLTAEQIMIAVFHLERTANAAYAHRVAAQQAAAIPTPIDGAGGRGDLSPAELDKIARDPRGGLRQ